MKMKFALVTSAMALAFASNAIAADMRYPAPRRSAPAYSPPPPAAYFSWTGFYIGAQGGYGWGESEEVYFPNKAKFIGTQTYDIDGALAGGVLGFNWALAGFIIGIEGEGNWANIKGNSAEINLGSGDTYHTKISSYSTVKGRIGMGFDRTLLYVTGGGAWASVQSRYNPAFNVRNCAGTVCETTDVHSGWVVGAGGEWAFTPNVSFKIEYNYVALDTSTAHFSAAGLNRSEWDNDFSVIKAGINFRFGGGGGPVYANN
jgi:outer membrane immunogenic protein